MLFKRIGNQSDILFWTFLICFQATVNSLKTSLKGNLPAHFLYSFPEGRERRKKPEKIFKYIIFTYFWRYQKRSIRRGACNSKHNTNPHRINHVSAATRYGNDIRNFCAQNAGFILCSEANVVSGYCWDSTQRVEKEPLLDFVVTSLPSMNTNKEKLCYKHISSPISKERWLWCRLQKGG